MSVAGFEVGSDGWEGSESNTWPGPKVTTILRKARKIGVFVGENKLVLYFLLILKKNIICSKLIRKRTITCLFKADGNYHI